MRKSTIVLAILLSCLCLDCYASDEAVELLMNAFQHSGCNPELFRSGYAEFEQEEESIQTDMVWNQYAISVDRTSHISLLFLGNTPYFVSDGKSCKRRCDTHEKVYLVRPDGTLKSSYVENSRAISMGNPSQEDSCYYFNWRENDKTLECYSQFRGGPEFQEFGRVHNMNGSIIAGLFHSRFNRGDFTFPAGSKELMLQMLVNMGYTCEIVGEETYDQTEKAIVIEVKQDGKLREKYHIDPTRGYICPLLYFADPTGNSSERYVAERFFEIPGNHLFYPGVYRTERKYPSGENRQSYRLVPGTVLFNQLVTSQEFSIEIPAETKVFQHIYKMPPPTKRNKPGKHITNMYRAITDGVVSLAEPDENYNVEKMSWLKKTETKEDVIQYYHYNPYRGNYYRWIRIFLKASGLILITIAVWLKWKEHLAKRATY